MRPKEVKVISQTYLLWNSSNSNQKPSIRHNEESQSPNQLLYDLGTLFWLLCRWIIDCWKGMNQWNGHVEVDKKVIQGRTNLGYDS